MDDWSLDYAWKGMAGMIIWLDVKLNPQTEPPGSLYKFEDMHFFFRAQKRIWRSLYCHGTDWKRRNNLWRHL